MRCDRFIAGAIVVAVVGAGAAALVTNHALAQDAKPRVGLVPVGEMAPSWSLADPQGNLHSLEDYRGKVVVMDFWATWCAPCKIAMPGLQDLSDKYKDRGLVVLGVNTWEGAGPQEAIDYMNEHGYTYSLLLEGDDVAEAYGLSALPTFFVIGVDGKVIMNRAGFTRAGEQQLVELIERTLPDQQDR